MRFFAMGATRLQTTLRVHLTGFDFGDRRCLYFGISRAVGETMVVANRGWWSTQFNYQSF